MLYEMIAVVSALLGSSERDADHVQVRVGRPHNTKEVKEYFLPPHHLTSLTLCHYCRHAAST
jgi:hypothetical protein